VIRSLACLKVRRCVSSICFFNISNMADVLTKCVLELGPCQVNEKFETYVNPHSWSEVSNMLFISQPLGTGACNATPSSGNMTHHWPSYFKDSHTLRRRQAPSTNWQVPSRVKMSPVFKAATLLLMLLWLVCPLGLYSRHFRLIAVKTQPTSLPKPPGKSCRDFSADYQRWTRRSNQRASICGPKAMEGKQLRRSMIGSPFNTRC
jgi:hypothetical protein